jgi:hypothetical protein
MPGTGKWRPTGVVGAPTAYRWKEHKEHDAYSKALERLLRDLKVEAGQAPNG